ncbi:MAG TPA: glycosyltransferase family 9 protein, partial [Cyclobacteriaceae bacterium]|nr:glycosyltransferase family 9 protein [Cyclobacteriaceae bacterium]
MSDSIRHITVQVYYQFGNALLKVLAWLLFQERTDVGKILIFRTGSIGDNICAIPSITSIRKYFSKSEIHILTTAGTQSPISMARLLSTKYYDKLIDYEGFGKRALYSLVRKNNYDLVIELPQNMAGLGTLIRNMVFFRLAGIRAGWGWELATVLWFRRTQERLISFPSERDRLLNILSKNGVCIDGSNVFPLNIMPEDVEVVSELMQSKGLSSENWKSLIALVPGAKRPQNRYPLERYMDLAKWLVEKGYGIVVIG